MTRVCDPPCQAGLKGAGFSLDEDFELLPLVLLTTKLTTSNAAHTTNANKIKNGAPVDKLPISEIPSFYTIVLKKSLLNCSQGNFINDF
jgi:hypothetical protein